MTAPKPTGISAIDELSRQLQKTKNSETRARLIAALYRLRHLYGIEQKTPTKRDLDMRRRQAFVRDRHPFAVTKVRASNDIIL